MKGDMYENQCYRNGPCLHGDPVSVNRANKWDYYDRDNRSYVRLECRLNQKFITPSLLQIEQAEKYQSGMGTKSFESSDLQLADTNGVWFTNSSDPESYQWPANADEPKTCNICDIVCEIRDMQKYMAKDGSCPYDDPAPQSVYSKVADYDTPCQDFLHPLLLQDLKAINKRKARATKAKLSGYLTQKKWRDALINKGERILDVWKRNYQPTTLFYSSFSSIALYIQNLPLESQHNEGLLQRIRENLEYSPSFKENLAKGEWEQRMLQRIDRFVEKARKKGVQGQRQRVLRGPPGKP